jgi:hypothetical protein
MPAPAEPPTSDAFPSDRYGPAKRPDRSVARPRPDGMTDATVAALGKISEALEAVEHARGLLYNFHRLSGTADLTLQDGVAGLRTAGHAELADEIDRVLVGRDVIPGRWTFQIVEEYDSQYWQVFRATEEWVREQIGAPQHLYEAEMKVDEQDSRGGDQS